MNCQHCGAELQSKRAKNCPVCAAIKAEANRRGTYSFVMEAFAMAQADGLTGEAVHEVARSAHEAGVGKRNQWMDDYRAAAKRQREIDAEIKRQWMNDPRAMMDEEERADYDAANFQTGPARREADIFG